MWPHIMTGLIIHVLLLLVIRVHGYHTCFNSVHVTDVYCRIRIQVGTGTRVPVQYYT